MFICLLAEGSVIHIDSNPVRTDGTQLARNSEHDKSGAANPIDAVVTVVCFISDMVIYIALSLTWLLTYIASKRLSGKINVPDSGKARQYLLE